jgi:elongation factor G
VEKGVRRSMARGPLAGCPVVDVSAALFDGKDHPVDSSDIAFQLAGEQCFSQAVQKADPVLLEPIYNLEVYVPEELMGNIMGDLSGRRARIQGQIQVGSTQRIDAQVPLREVLDYANVLQSMTSGRGTHRKVFSHYEEVPGHLSQEVIAERKRREEEK